MTPRLDEGWLFKTGQAWKVLVSLAGAVLTLVLFVAAVAVEGSGFRFLRWSVAGLAVAVATMSFLLASVRCPACRRRPMGRVFRRASAEGSELLVFRECPYCGYAPNVRDQSAARGTCRPPE